MAFEINYTLIVSVFGAIIISWVGAFWTMITKVREKHWLVSLERKQKFAEILVVSVDQFPKTVAKFSNLNMATKLDLGSMAATLSYLTDRHFGNDNNYRRELIMNSFPHVSPSVKREDFRDVIMGLSNEFTDELFQKQLELNSAYAQYMLFAYDPSKIKPIDWLAINIAKELNSKGPPFDLDYDEIFSEWRRVSGRMKAYLRLDLFQSGKSYKKARNISSQWVKKNERGYNLV